MMRIRSINSVARVASRGFLWVMIFLDSVFFGTVLIKFISGGVEGLRGWILHTFISTQYRGLHYAQVDMETAVRVALRAHERFFILSGLLITSVVIAIWLDRRVSKHSQV